MEKVSMSIRFSAQQHQRMSSAVDGMVFRSINHLVVVAVANYLHTMTEGTIFPNVNTSTTSNALGQTPVASTKVDTPAPLVVSTPKKNKALKYTQNFLDFWTLYPRKMNKRDAFKTYLAATKTVDPSEILLGLEACIDQRLFKDMQYIPYPATWLNKGGWEVESKSKEDATEAPSEYVDTNWIMEGPSCDTKDAVADIIRSEVGAYDYNAWIMPTRWVTKNGGAGAEELFIVCPDQVHSDWIKKNYLHTITEALSEHFQCLGLSPICAVTPCSSSEAVERGINQ